MFAERSGRRNGHPHPQPHGIPPRHPRPSKNEKAFLLIPAGYPAEGCTVPDLAKKPLADVMIER